MWKPNIGRCMSVVRMTPMTMVEWETNNETKKKRRKTTTKCVGFIAIDALMGFGFVGRATYTVDELFRLIHALNAVESPYNTIHTFSRATSIHSFVYFYYRTSCEHFARHHPLLATDHRKIDAVFFFFFFCWKRKCGEENLILEVLSLNAIRCDWKKHCSIRVGGEFNWARFGI